LCDHEPGCFGGVQLCGLTLYGDVVETNVNFGAAALGDPNEAFPFTDADCAGNTIHGTVLMKDSNFINPFNGEASEFEGNTVTGSVRLDHSTAEVNGNTVGGSLLCLNGFRHPPAGFKRTPRWEYRPRR
jgi:hypothetical protein